MSKYLFGYWLTLSNTLHGLGDVITTGKLLYYNSRLQRPTFFSKKKEIREIRRKEIRPKLCIKKAKRVTAGSMMILNNMQSKAVVHDEKHA